MSFSDISKRLTNVITNEMDYSKDKEEIIAYAIETAFLAILGTFLIILFGYLTNSLMPVISAAAFGGLLRKVSGGAHFHTPIMCMTAGSIIYCLVGILAKELVYYDVADKYVLIFMLLVSFLLVSFLAPVDSESKPIHSSNFKFKLKILSIFFVVISFLTISFSNSSLLNVSAALGVLYQSITLLPIFNNKGGENNL